MQVWTWTRDNIRLDDSHAQLVESLAMKHEAAPSKLYKHLGAGRVVFLSKIPTEVSYWGNNHIPMYEQSCVRACVRTRAHACVHAGG